jgi:phosphonate transport system substrate-binding protein
VTRALRWGTYLAPNMNAVHQSLAEWAGDRLGRPVEFSVESDYRHLRDCEIDLAFVCGLPYVVIADRHPGRLAPLVAPVLSPPRYGGRPVYYSDVIVRTESDVQTFDDLRGAVLGFNEPLSHSGFGVVRVHLAEHGEDLSFFAATVRLDFHQAAIEAVIAGDANAAAIDSQTLAVELRERPALKERIRVVAELGPSPIQPLVATDRVDPDLIRELTAILLTAHDDAGLEDPLMFGLIDRFVAVQDRDYDPIRAMREAAETGAPERVS